MITRVGYVSGNVGLNAALQTSCRSFEVIEVAKYKYIYNGEQFWRNCQTTVVGKNRWRNGKIEVKLIYAMLWDVSVTLLEWTQSVFPKSVSIWESLSDNILEEFSTSSVWYWYLVQCCNAVECINDGCDWLARATVSVPCLKFFFSRYDFEQPIFMISGWKWIWRSADSGPSSHSTSSFHAAAHS